METLETLRGNTITLKDSKKNRQVPSKRWCFTAFGAEMIILESKILSGNLKYIFGEEICPVTKRLHIQGYLECDKKIRPIEVFNTCTVHWEHAKGNRQANYEYCCKDGKFKTNLKCKRRTDGSYAWLEEI